MQNMLSPMLSGENWVYLNAWFHLLILVQRHIKHDWSENSAHPNFNFKIKVSSEHYHYLISR